MLIVCATKIEMLPNNLFPVILNHLVCLKVKLVCILSETLCRCGDWQARRGQSLQSSRIGIDMTAVQSDFMAN